MISGRMAETGGRSGRRAAVETGGDERALNRGEIGAQFDEIPSSLDERAGETALEGERRDRLRLMSRFTCTRNPFFL
jgi:hypothetical protein